MYKTHFEDVFDFHRKFGVPISLTPTTLNPQRAQERADFMQEELDEFVSALGQEDIVKQADALVDLVYVTIGTAVQMGLPWEALWNEVQRANMEKVRGETKRGMLYDVAKPHGWRPPDLLPILKDAGYKDKPDTEYKEEFL